MAPELLVKVGGVVLLALMALEDGIGSS